MGRSKSTVPTHAKSVENTTPLYNSTNTPGEARANGRPILDIDRMRSLREEDKRKRSERAKKSRRRTPPTKTIDWSRLDQRGNPAITFSPSPKELEKLIKILDRKPRDATRKQIVDKLSVESSRIYTRYRRKLLERRGASRLGYKMPEQELKFARRFGEFCIRKAVTPQACIKYWHYNIKNFAQSNLKIPSLAFLSSPTNIETVACSTFDGEAVEQRVNMNGFSDVSSLDPKLRRRLTAAGFETNELDDRFLMTIQKTAQAISNGADLFVAAGMRPMVVWVVENVYGGVDEA